MPDKKKFIFNSNEKKSEKDNDNRNTVNGNRQQFQDAKSETFDSSSQFHDVVFTTFINSLSASALAYLGLMEDPSGNAQTKDVSMARQTIDVLAMLKEKTRGNLKTEDKEMLDRLLYELRLKYVKELNK